jgi:membrane-associated phospholipid phosphatase
MTFQRVLVAYLLVFVLVQALFAAFPAIDLAVSRLFAHDGRGFIWSDGAARTVNLVVRRLGEAVVLLLLAGLVLGFLTGRVQGNGLRLLAYPLLCVALACGGLVNLVLKAQVGRARPHTLVEFGGTARFTPPWHVVDECARNCSFASGEVAMAASLAIPAVAVLWPHLARRRGRLLALIVAAAYVAVVSLLRIGLGRHFLSDAVFSILFSAGAALLLYPALRIDQARQRPGALMSPRSAPALAQQRAAP